ncbi:DNA alkylation repair protein [Bdellovibrio sp.]|uniref:DNA alkylation repair protein n=1 Tax=Bdellovibrio sp. TaxID=28201 RepID=UPI0039E6EB92
MLKDLRKDISKLQDPDRAKNLRRFFKTGKGEYGEGDLFVGLNVPQSRSLAKKYATLSLREIQTLLKSKIHEERLIALFILVGKYSRGSQRDQEKIYKFYLKNTKYINNWDLVDLSAERIVGAYLYDKDRKVLRRLATSSSLWERRIAVLSTFHFIKHQESQETLRLAKVLLKDEHDLIHKAVGWMLREVGKRVSKKDLKGFLDVHAAKMPRTMLRYALEHLSPQERRHYMDL